MSKSLTLKHNQVTVDFSQFFQQSQPRPTAQGPPLNVNVSIQPDGTWTVSSQHLATLQPFLDSLRARETPLQLPKDVHTFVHKANNGRRIITVAYILDPESSEVVYNCSVFHKEHRKCKPNGKPFLPYHSESHLWTAVVRLYRRPQKLRVDPTQDLHQAILEDIPRSIRQPKGSQRNKTVTEKPLSVAKAVLADDKALNIAREAVDKMLRESNLRIDPSKIEVAIQKMHQVADSIDRRELDELKQVVLGLVEETVRKASEQIVPKLVSNKPHHEDRCNHDHDPDKNLRESVKFMNTMAMFSP